MDPRVDQRQPTSLRRVFWFALLPLALLLLSSFALIIVMVGRVHHNVECMFVETGEIAQARSLADELRGIEQWVVAAPALPASARTAADADARQHLATAVGILRRFGPEVDPSDAEHQSREDTLTATLRVELELLQGLLGGPRASLEDADPHVRAASAAAAELAATIEAESRLLGRNLVQSSEEFVDLVLVIAAVAALTLIGAALLFQRRILSPLADLRAAVHRVGEGDLDLRLTLHHDDELGLLAATLQSMTQKLRSHQEDLEERVAQRTNELLRTARLADLGTLAAGVAHEINNPLAAIATCAEGLLRDEQRAIASHGADGPALATALQDRTRIREYLEIIAKEAMRVRDTTARLLAFARPESGRREPVWLAREVREVATMLDHSATRSGVVIDLDLPANVPPVLGDPADLRQVAFNLLKNALDVSPKNGTIWVRVLQRDDAVVLEVEDRGGGVAPELRDKIFEPFVTTKDPGQGTGLGLAISHRIVTDHGGSLRLQTPTHGGACFAMSLPRLR